MRTSLIATVLAAAATEALTAVVRAAGVDLTVGGSGGTAGSVVPGRRLRPLGRDVHGHRHDDRRAGQQVLVAPGPHYRIVTGALVLVSLGTPLTAAATSASTRLTLVVAHLVAAAIIVPLVSRSLAGTR